MSPDRSHAQLIAPVAIPTVSRTPCAAQARRVLRRFRKLVALAAMNGTAPAASIIHREMIKYYFSAALIASLSSTGIMTMQYGVLSATTKGAV
jgi:hypothetical protein